MFETIHPRDWGIPRPDKTGPGVEKLLGFPLETLEERVKNCVYGFLETLYDPREKGLRHYYRPDKKYYAELDSGNFLMALNYLVVYDLSGDSLMLERAEDCFRWAYEHATEIHPMFSWQGGVRDGFKPNELYVKYTGDAFLAAIALYRRTRNEKYLFCIKQFHNFFKQARKVGFCYKYNLAAYQWSSTGFVWRSFGFPLTAYIELYEVTEDEKYLQEAAAWADHGLGLQADNGCFYLLDGEFWNSDLTAPELRGLVFLSEITKDRKYLDAASRFADWLIPRQDDDGSWPVGIDRDDEVCAPNIGPGDMPNIALSFLRLYMRTGEEKYFDPALKAVRYSLSMQAVEGGKYPLYLNDRSVKWGFWSWDPLFDYSLSGDQSVHHIRGILFMAYYIANFKSLC